jgi:hypothetical protein
MRTDFGVRCATTTPARLPRRGPRLLAAALQICSASSLLSLNPVALSAQRRATTTITIDTSRPANRIMPSRALGAGVDGHAKGVNDLQLTPPNIREMQSAGMKSLTYRLRTELAGDVWHWNPRGTWSEAQSRQGYWTSDAAIGEPISLSFGYSLPRRGNTIDQANNADYSRIDDGDTETFWKSNPYLDRQFTGDDNKLHPQWIVIDFEKPIPINLVRILWGQPFAETFRIQYGDFDDVSDIALNAPGTWRDFPISTFTGRVSNLPKFKGDLLQVAGTPIKARWIRIVMTQSSGVSARPTDDVRDRLGFVVKELAAGVIDSRGHFHDRLHHGKSIKEQTIIYVSSTDPWHRESDLDEGVEQVGLDRIYDTGLTNNLPVLVPTGLLYDTPENAANEIHYLRARGYKFERVELGEEPDGQYVSPEDFGALYRQFAEAIHRVDPSVKLGGPSLQEILYDRDMPGHGNGEWMRRFFEYLKRRGRAADYSFFSFEWYPFDDVCAPVGPQLARAPRLMEAALRAMRQNGLSQKVPWIISEYGYSAFASRAEIDIEGALLNADIVGKFLTLGGDQAFLFGYTPGYADRDFPCTAGNNMLFSLEDDRIESRFATYFGARLLTQEWLKSSDEVYEIYPAVSDTRDAEGNALVTAYAARRPDGAWSLLLINKDPQREFQASMSFANRRNDRTRFRGTVDVFQYSRAQYVLGGSQMQPKPLKADDPEHLTIHATIGNSLNLKLQPYSLTVVRGGVK